MALKPEPGERRPVQLQVITPGTLQLTSGAPWTQNGPEIARPAARFEDFVVVDRGVLSTVAARGVEELDLVRCRGHRPQH